MGSISFRAEARQDVAGIDARRDEVVCRIGCGDQLRLSPRGRTIIMGLGRDMRCILIGSIRNLAPFACSCMIILRPRQPALSPPSYPGASSFP